MTGTLNHGKYEIKMLSPAKLNDEWSQDSFETDKEEISCALLNDISIESKVEAVIKCHFAIS